MHERPCDFSGGLSPFRGREASCAPEHTVAPRATAVKRTYTQAIPLQDEHAA